MSASPILCKRCLMFVNQTSSLLVSVSTLLLFPRPNYLSSHQSSAAWFLSLAALLQSDFRPEWRGSRIRPQERKWTWWVLLGGGDQGLGRVIRARHRIPRRSPGNVMRAGRGCWKWGQEGSTVTLATSDSCTSSFKEPSRGAFLSPPLSQTPRGEEPSKKWPWLLKDAFTVSRQMCTITKFWCL